MLAGNAILILARKCKKVFRDLVVWGPFSFAALGSFGYFLLGVDCETSDSWE
jgi:hypothetical protein